MTATTLLAKLGLTKRTFRWILVFGVFMSQFFCGGVAWAYGVYANAYCKSITDPIDNKYRYCTIPGAVGEAVSTIFGLVVGYLAENPKIGFRTTALAGSIIWGAGFVAAGFSTSFIAIIMTQGFLTGVGASLNYFAMLGMIPRYFAKVNDGRTAAFGLAISGTGCGGFVLAISTQAMIDAWGMSQTLWVTGVVGGGVLSLCSFLCIPPEKWDDGSVQPTADAKTTENGDIKPTISVTPTEETEKVVVATADIQAAVAELAPRELEAAAAPTQPPTTIRTVITSKPFLLACAIIFFLPFGSLSPAYFATSFSQDVLGLPATTSAFMVSILNISSTVGRAVQGIFAEKIGGPANNVAVCVFFAGFLQLIYWPFIKSMPAMIVYMILQGLVGGGYNGLLPSMITGNFDESVSASALSISYSFFTYGSLLGPIIGGYLIDITGGYIAMMGFSGGCVLVAFVFALWLRMDMAKWKMFVNV